MSNKVDIVKVDEVVFKECLNELTKEELIELCKGLKTELEKDYESFTFEFNNVPFDRIRRITGYLVGTIDRWNDAKKTEEHDRVKHF